MRQDKSVIVALDIGTTKVCAIVARIGDDGPEICGLGTVPSEGLRKGMVVNMEVTVGSIRSAVALAEEESGVEIESVFAGIAGGHIRSAAGRGKIAIARGKEITSSDVRRVIDAAKAVSIPLDREVIHVLPAAFTVDEQRGISNPVGMKGQLLEVEVHIVTGAVAAAQNLIKCINDAGFEVEDIVLQPLASAEAVLNPEERSLGVVLVDLGGGTTDLLVCRGDGVKHSRVFAIGGDHVTTDLAIGLHTPVREAEELKKAYGVATERRLRKGRMVDVPSVAGAQPRSVPQDLLYQIIRPRIEETLALVVHELDETGVSDILGAGVVLTGGGSLLPGIDDVAAEALGMPARIGRPHCPVAGEAGFLDDPAFATAVGLVLYGLRQRGRDAVDRISGGNVFKKVMSRMKSWLGEFL